MSCRAISTYFGWVVVFEQFRSDEEFLAGDAGRFDPLANFIFVLVSPCTAAA